MVTVEAAEEPPGGPGVLTRALAVSGGEDGSLEQVQRHPQDPKDETYSG